MSEVRDALSSPPVGGCLLADLLLGKSVVAAGAFMPRTAV